MSALANLRDVATAAPDRLVGGVLLRSEAPQPGDDDPSDVVWPPRTVLDLRSPAELGGAPHPLARPGTAVVAVPMTAALAPAARARQRDRSTPLARLYLDALEAAGEWAPALVHHAARAPGPVLVHCAAGKDRTGVAVALLLLLADVAREAIERDHARTAQGLDAVHARLDAAGPGRRDPRHGAVAPEALAAVLDALTATGAAGFVAAHGVAADDVATWRRRIVSRGDP